MSRNRLSIPLVALVLCATGAFILACSPAPTSATEANKALVRRYVDQLTQVNEDELAAGIRGLVANEHLVAEGAGIAGVAAALAGRVDLRGRRVAIVVTGANIDLDRLRTVLA